MGLMVLPQLSPFSSSSAEGRSVLPVTVRRAAGVPEGATIVVDAEGEGRLVLKTPDAVRARVWAGAPVPANCDLSADVRSLREQDTAIADAASAVRSASSSGNGSDAVGAALLARLDL